mgnify:CR=1 FL=1
MGEALPPVEASPINPRTGECQIGAVMRVSAQQMLRRAMQTAGVAVASSQVLEPRSEAGFDRIVVTHCDPRTQALRLVERDGISREQATRRISAQAEPGDRLAAADHVIDTSGSLEETRARAREVFTALRREWESLKTPH